MSDRNEHMFRHPLADGLKFFDEEKHKLEVERHRADAQAMHAEAYRQMPADLRQQSETWGVRALMEAVWLNGWDCGYRQSVRDRTAADFQAPAPNTVSAEAVIDATPAEALEPALRVPAVDQRETEGIASDAAETFVNCRSFPAPTPSPDVENLQAELAAIRKSVRNAMGAIESNQVVDKDVHGTLNRVLKRLDALTPALNVRCPCTTFEHSEECPMGYPSLLCRACSGTGNAPLETVVALAAEMMKVAEQAGEVEDPFAARETIEIIKSQHAQMRAALQTADQFITNGIELGFIRMPDPDGGDPALLTPGIVRAASEGSADV